MERCFPVRVTVAATLQTYLVTRLFSPPFLAGRVCSTHRTASNFRFNRSVRSQLPQSALPGLACCRLALSESHLAAGFLNGSVYLFKLPEGNSLAIYRPNPHHETNAIFNFTTICGLAFPQHDRLIFASLNGDIHSAPLGNVPVSGTFRRAHAGNIVKDGLLDDFTADYRHWVGLFTGMPGCSWHVWDAKSEQLIFIGGTLTDSEAILGGRIMAELGVKVLGRVRIAAHGKAVGCTSAKMRVLDMDNPGVVLKELEHERSGIVNPFDVYDD